MERLLTQILNMVLRQVMNRGINHLSRRGKDPKTMTPEEREQAAKARELADKAKKMARLTRRL